MKIRDFKALLGVGALIAIGSFSPMVEASSCKVGSATALNHSCANGWDPGSQERGSRKKGAPIPELLDPFQIATIKNHGFFERKPDRFNPLEIGEDESSLRRLILKKDRCATVKIREIRSMDNMARVSCGSLDAWVNLDYLACHRAEPGPASEETLVESAATCFQEIKGDFQSLLRQKVSAERIADQYQNQNIVKKALEKVEEFRGRIAHDRDLLLNAHQLERVSDQDLYRRLQRSRDRLRDQFRKLSSFYGLECDQNAAASTRLSMEDQVRGRTQCQLVRSAWKMAEFDINQAENLQSSKILFDESKLDRSAAGGAIRDAWSKRKGENGFDALVYRQVLFSSLPEEKQLELVSVEGGALSLVRKSKEVPGLFYLHNGYVFGGNRLSTRGAAIDCSEFVSGVLTGKDGGFPLNTRQFREIAVSLSGGSAKLSPSQRKFAKCLEPVRVRDGERLQPGDLVVYRSEIEGSGGSGHIVVVESQDSSDGSIRTVEAAGDRFGTVGRYSRPIYEPSCGSGKARPVRPDVWALRFKGDVCKLD